MARPLQAPCLNADGIAVATPAIVFFTIGHSTHPVGEFVDMLRSLGAEAEQFLNVLELGDRKSVYGTFLGATEAVLSRIRTSLGADSASLWIRTSAGIERLCGDSADPAELAAAMMKYET